MERSGIASGEIKEKKEGIGGKFDGKKERKARSRRSCSKKRKRIQRLSEATEGREREDDWEGIRIGCGVQTSLSASEIEEMREKNEVLENERK